MGKRRRLLVASLAGLVAALVALSLLEFESPALGQAALRRVGEAMGARITARAFALRPLSGLALEQVEAWSEFPGGRWSLAIDSLVLDHRVWPLLLGRVEVDRIILRRPRLRMEEGAGARPAPSLPAASAASGWASRLRLAIARAEVHDGTIELLAPRAAPLRVEGLRVSLSALAAAPGAATLTGFSASGEASAERIHFERAQARGAQGTFRLGQGKLEAQGLRFETDEGRFAGALQAELDRLPLVYTLELRGDPLDLNALAGMRGEGALGPASIELQARGDGPGPNALRGRGILPSTARAGSRDAPHCWRCGAGAEASAGRLLAEPEINGRCHGSCRLNVTPGDVLVD